MSAPAWSDHFAPAHLEPVESPWHVERDWAWGGSTGEGVRVAVVDSGVDPDHPHVHGAVDEWASFRDGPTSGEPHGDPAGHGTACADAIRVLAPRARLLSVQILGANACGRGTALLDGLAWAIERRPDVVNLSLGTPRRDLWPRVQELLDEAWFRGIVVVAALSNRPIETRPAHSASVISVATHTRARGYDPFEFYVNPTAPPEFGAPGFRVELANGRREVVPVTGNSFAAAHLAGVAALVRAKHPAAGPSEVRAILRATARNARGPGPERQPRQEN